MTTGAHDHGSAGPVEHGRTSLAGVMKQAAKEAAEMTVGTAKEQLALCLWFLHLEDDELEIKNCRLVSKNRAMDIPVSKLMTIIPYRGTVMAVRSGKDT